MKDKIDLTIVLFLLIFVLGIGLIGSAVYSGIKNESNRITEGVIIDKEISEGYTYADYSDNYGNFRSYPTIYKFLIEGEKNGETVKYWTSVTPEEYDTFKVGEYYRK